MPARQVGQRGREAHPERPGARALRRLLQFRHHRHHVGGEKSTRCPLLSGVSSKTDLTERGNGWFFRSAETDALMAHAFAEILVKNLKLKTIAYIGVNDD